MILVTGPTGCGKTVSLYTGLNILNKPKTPTSPPPKTRSEINLPGVNQVNVNERSGLTFAAALRAFLRQDPDVIMVGEIRDLETAEIAIKAAQTGHLVLSTLHTNDAPQTLTRLMDMGVAPTTSPLGILIIAQRLARRLCNSARRRSTCPHEALLKEGFKRRRHRTASGRLIGPSAARACTDGYKGRVGIYQVMPITEEIQRIILDGGSAMEIATQAARKASGTCASPA